MIRDPMRHVLPQTRVVSETLIKADLYFNSYIKCPTGYNSIICCLAQDYRPNSKWICEMGYNGNTLSAKIFILLVSWWVASQRSLNQWFYIVFVIQHSVISGDLATFGLWTHGSEPRGWVKRSLVLGINIPTLSCFTCDDPEAS